MVFQARVELGDELVGNGPDGGVVGLVEDVRLAVVVAPGSVRRAPPAASRDPPRRARLAGFAAASRPPPAPQRRGASPTNRYRRRSWARLLHGSRARRRSAGVSIPSAHRRASTDGASRHDIPAALLLLTKRRGHGSPKALFKTQETSSAHPPPARTGSSSSLTTVLRDAVDTSRLTRILPRPQYIVAVAFL